MLNPSNVLLMFHTFKNLCEAHFTSNLFIVLITSNVDEKIFHNEIQYDAMLNLLLF